MMKVKTLVALRRSIAKWDRYSRVDSLNSFEEAASHMGAADCPLFLRSLLPVEDVS
jgi:hypothetical protein